MSNLQQHIQDASLDPHTVVSMKRNINSLIEGRINSVGTVTLKNGATQTTLYDNHANPLASYFFFPQTAHGAAVGASLWYDPTSITINIPGGTGGSITLNHSSITQTDCTFGYVAFT